MTALATTDLDQIQHLPQRIMDAWRDHDASAFADVFAEDASMVLPGILQQGRDNIQQFMSSAFAGPYKGTQVVGRPFALRELGPDAAIVLTQGGVLGPGQKELTEDQKVIASWVVERTTDGWQLAAYQNSPAVAAN